MLLIHIIQKGYYKPKTKKNFENLKFSAKETDTHPMYNLYTLKIESSIVQLKNTTII